MKTKTFTTLLGAGSLAISSLYANPELQKQIDELKANQKELEAKLEAAGELIDNIDNGNQSGKSKLGFGKTHIGGYGELHYNHLNSQTGGSDKREVDFHRFVLLFGHEFTEKINFVGELELEHSIAGDGQVGEVELEQAYVNFKLNDKHQLNAGLFLIPVGILNETHEPPTFYGVERNPVEKNIIPTTWWEAGLGLNGELSPGLSYDLAIHSGLNTSAASAYKVRSGRQKVGNATAEDGAITARLRWNRIKGFEWTGTIQFQGDVTQGADNTAGDATLFETHIIYNYEKFSLRALYATWDLDGAGPQAIGADEQEGFYIEPSYRINKKFGIFARYSQWDNAAGDSTASEMAQTNVGLNYWPHEQVVLKFDYEDQDYDTGNERRGINLGVGFDF